MIYTHFSVHNIKYVMKDNPLQTISNIIYQQFKFNKITFLFSGIGKKITSIHYNSFGYSWSLMEYLFSSQWWQLYGNFAKLLFKCRCRVDFLDFSVTFCSVSTVYWQFVLSYNIEFGNFWSLPFFLFSVSLFKI